MTELSEKPTAAEIIGRSILMHPSLFRDSLIKQAEMHDDYSRVCRDPGAYRGAIAQKNACLKIYDVIGQAPMLIGGHTEAANIICSETGTAVVALNAAGKLQCLPRHMLTAAAVMLDEEKAK